MAITKLPKIIVLQTLACAICHVKLTLDRATAGPFTADNHQAFACVSHFREPELLIVGWANFAVLEQNRHLKDELGYLENYE
jgi:hypothetical protein